mmetsp:Transcript_38332/g.68487  ORF Transcript_38332/g.68487 Transcript_38332/m.68487 type:complete len:198 (-) Transcript_38332:126-719(-)
MEPREHERGVKDSTMDLFTKAASKDKAHEATRKAWIQRKRAVSSHHRKSLKQPLLTPVPIKAHTCPTLDDDNFKSNESKLAKCLGAPKLPDAALEQPFTYCYKVATNEQNMKIGVNLHLKLLSHKALNKLYENAPRDMHIVAVESGQVGYQVVCPTTHREICHLFNSFAQHFDPPNALDKAFYYPLNRCHSMAICGY